MNSIYTKIKRLLNQNSGQARPKTGFPRGDAAFPRARRNNRLTTHTIVILSFYHIFTFVFAQNTRAQTITPSVQCTQGAYLTGGGVQLSLTLAQPVGITMNADGYELSFGFEQPELDLRVGSISTGPFCAGTQIRVPFTATDLLDSNNVFTAQLSDNTGSFASPVNIGSDTTNVSDTILATIPANTPAGSNYKVRVISSYPAFYELIGAGAPVFLGKASGAFTVLPAPFPLNPYANSFMLCSSDSTSINVPNSQGGIKYTLQYGSTAIDSGLGTGFNISMNSTIIDSTTIFNVLATDTTTGCNIILNPLVQIGLAPPPATPVFVAGDTVIHADSLCCYKAFADSSLYFRYSITSGDASIDSISGCLLSVDSNFTVRATVFGGSGCSSASADLPVRVTQGSDTTHAKALNDDRALLQLPPVAEWDFTGGNNQPGAPLPGAYDWIYKIKQVSDGGYICTGYGYSEADQQSLPSIFKLSNTGIPQWKSILTNAAISSVSGVGRITSLSGTDDVFQDFIEYSDPGTGATQYVLVGTVAEANTAGHGNRTIVVGKYNTDGTLVSSVIIPNTTWGTATFGLGTSRAYHIQLSPTTAGFLISGFTDGQGEGDMLIFELTWDLSFITWNKYIGPAPNGGLGDFVTNVVPADFPTSYYTIYFTGGGGPFIRTPEIGYYTRNNGSGTPTSVAKTSCDVIIAEIPVSGGLPGTPIIHKWDLSVPGSYAPLACAPYLDDGTPGHTSSDAVNFFQGQHDDNGYAIAWNMNNISSGQLVVLAEANVWLGGPYFDGQSLPSGQNDNNQTFNSGYKDEDLVLMDINTSTWALNTNAAQVMHLSGGDFQPGFAQDANGNFYVSGTCADNAKTCCTPEYDNCDGVDNTINIGNWWIYSDGVPDFSSNVMHVAKFNNNFSRIWELTKLSNQWGIDPFVTPALPQLPIIYNECCFSLALNDEGGFVIAGNNCIRGDDYIVHKFYTDCEPDISPGYNYPNGWLLSGTHDGTGLGTVRVQGTIEVAAGVTAELDNYTLEFGNTKQLNSLDNMLNFGTNTAYNVNPTRIQIEPSGVLILKNCTLRGISNCYNGQPMQWEGIVLKGDPTNPVQTNVYQGALILEDGTTIQDAVVGVDADSRYYGAQSDDPYNDNAQWGACQSFGYPLGNQIPQTYDSWATYRQTPMDPGQGGGWLQAASSNFINCPAGVIMSPYTGQSQSFLFNCTFDENAYMAEPINRQTGLNYHIAMGSLNFGTNQFLSYCTLNNSFNSNFTADKRGIGIWDINTQYNIGSPTDESDITTIENLTTGIEHDYLGTGTLSCLNATFTNNQNGLNLRGTLNDGITGCTFNVPDFTNGAAGLSAFGANVFAVCNNHFSGIGFGGPGLTGQAGAYVQSNTTTGGSVSMNYFDGLLCGLQTALSNPQFHYRQNTFGQTTMNYIGVALNPYDNGITANQIVNTLAGYHNPDNTFPALGFLGLNNSLLLGPVYAASNQYTYGLDNSYNGNEIGCSVFWDAGSSLYLTESYYGSNPVLAAPNDGQPPFTPTNGCSADYSSCTGCKDLTMDNPSSVSMEEREQEVRQILSDTTTSSDNKTLNLISYLEHFGDWDAQQLLVPAYYQLGDYNDMNRHLGAIRDTSDYAHDFKSFYTMIAAARQQGRDYGQLNNDEWTALRNFSRNSKNGIGGIAQNLLFKYKGEYTPLIPTAIKVKPAIVKKAVSEAPLTMDMQVYPNPMNDEAIVQYVLPGNDGNYWIQITDLAGKPIAGWHIADSNGEIELNKPDLAPGMYFCTLLQGDKIADVKKFIKL